MNLESAQEEMSGIIDILKLDAEVVLVADIPGDRGTHQVCLSNANNADLLIMLMSAVVRTAGAVIDLDLIETDLLSFLKQGLDGAYEEFCTSQNKEVH